MASGSSSGRVGSSSRSFQLGTDDVLCSYDDLIDQGAANGNRPDSSGKDHWENRTGRPLVGSYSEQENYKKQDLMSVVDKCMKKHSDNLLNFLEEIGGRLSQLEVYCYNLERSIGELRSDLTHDHKEADVKLRSLDKHLQEVHRSVQILRDKQELADTQKELAKLQLVQKEPSEGVSSSASEQKNRDDIMNAANKQLALALPQQTVGQTPAVATPPEQNLAYKEVHVQQVAPQLAPQAPYIMNPGGAYFSQPTQISSQPQQQQQNVSAQPPPQHPHIASQPPSFTHYQQQWSQQTSQPQQMVQPQHLASSQPMFPPQTTPVYPSYPLNPPVKASSETYSGGMPAAYSVPQSGGKPSEHVSYSYGGPSNMVQQPPSQTHGMQRQALPQPNESAAGPQLPKSGYMGTGTEPYPPQPPMQGYMMYGSEGSRTTTQSFHSGYSPSNANLRNQQSGPFHPPGAQPMHNHPYGELLEKAVSMGYTREQVASAIYRMEESNQPLDFNALLDMLNNGRGPGSSHRGWVN